MKGRFISGPAALLVLFLFFLPWVSVSCNGLLVGKFSGFDLALGSKLVALAGQSGLIPPGTVSGDQLLFIIPLIAIIAFILFLLAMAFKKASLIAAWATLIAGLTGIFVLAFKWLQLSNNEEMFFEVSVQPGLWGTVLGFILILVGSVVELTQLRKTAVSPPQTHPPPEKLVTPTFWLIVRSGDLNGQRFKLHDGMIFGRDADCDVVLPDTAVSSHHASISIQNGQVILHDQHSTNGSFVFKPGINDWVKIKQIQLQNDTKIKLGRTILEALHRNG